MVDSSNMNEYPGSFFALVSYVPDPLGSFLDALRQSFPGEKYPQAHITILPPRPLRVATESASRQALAVLRNFSAFDVELTSVQRFPDTDVLYLDVSEGDRLLHQLHAALNSGVLADQERFEFRPHLTLGGPIPSEALPAEHKRAESAWESWDAPRRFTLNEVAALWGTPSGNSAEWQRLWTFNLPAGSARQAAAGIIGQRS